MLHWPQSSWQGLTSASSAHLQTQHWFTFTLKLQISSPLSCFFFYLCIILPIQVSSFPPCHYQLHPLLSSPQADKELSPCNVIIDGFHKTTQPEPKKDREGERGLISEMDSKCAVSCNHVSSAHLLKPVCVNQLRPTVCLKSETEKGNYVCEQLSALLLTLFALIISCKAPETFWLSLSADQFITAVPLFQFSRKQRRETCHILWLVTLPWTREQSEGTIWGRWQLSD